MTSEEKLDVLLAIAEDFAEVVRRFVDESAAALRLQGHVLNLRDRTLVGIELKIDGAFRALIVDARAKRIEAVHHLKTMVEAFIYLHVVGRDQGDTMAQRLLARVCHDKARFFRLNPGHDPDGKHRETWEGAADGFARQGIARIEDVGPAAESVGMKGWYDAVYRAACEPAHMADLFEFMPAGPILNIRAGELRTGIGHAIIAVDQGLHVMFGAAKLVSDNQFNFTLSTSTFEERLNAVRLVVTSQ